MKRIVYTNVNGGVSVVIPAPKCQLTLEQIAQKDVPTGVPYWFVDASEIPLDRTARDAWELDDALGDPDGFGGESSEFTEAELLALYQQGVIGGEQ